jgi:hypothetical protein
VSKPKEHLMRTAFGVSQCGMRNVATTPVRELVTCLRCKRSTAYRKVER